MRCSLCAKPCRSRKRAVGVDANGTTRQMLVGPCCFDRGVTFIPAAPAALCKCGKAVAEHCGVCLDERRRRVPEPT